MVKEEAGVELVLERSGARGQPDARRAASLPQLRSHAPAIGQSSDHCQPGVPPAAARRHPRQAARSDATAGAADQTGRDARSFSPGRAPDL